jgi:lactoylglutathione lyase
MQMSPVSMWLKPGDIRIYRPALPAVTLERSCSWSRDDPLDERPMMTHITGVRTVSIPVDNQDTALRFYVDTLGFTKLGDVPTPGGGRWIELSPGGGGVILTLEPAAPGVTRGAIGIRFTTDDAEAAHAALTAAGVDSDEILHWPGVPAMFAFRDPDGNAFSITETA